jgi:hypothetical protein
MLNELKKLVTIEKKDRIDRVAYVRGKFRVENNLPFTIDNFEILHQEAQKLADENDQIKSKLATLSSSNFDLKSKLTDLETSNSSL